MSVFTAHSNQCNHINHLEYVLILLHTLPLHYSILIFAIILIRYDFNPLSHSLLDALDVQFDLVILGLVPYFEHFDDPLETLSDQVLLWRLQHQLLQQVEKLVQKTNLGLHAAENG